MRSSVPATGITRVFFAIWPLGAAGDAIATQVARLGLDGGRRVCAERLHLTLAFHGACDPDRIALLERCAAGIDTPAFRFTVDRLDGFRRGGTVWVGPSAPPRELLDLAGRLTPGAAQAPAPGRFQPHITVARRAERPSPTVFPAVQVPVTSFALVASGEAGRPGRYRLLNRWPLAACRGTACDDTRV